MGRIVMWMVVPGIRLQNSSIVKLCRPAMNLRTVLHLTAASRYTYRRVSLRAMRTSRMPDRAHSIAPILKESIELRASGWARLEPPF